MVDFVFNCPSAVVICFDYLLCFLFLFVHCYVVVFVLFYWLPGLLSLMLRAVGA